jgi:DNA-binding transcriptional MocR family regulator
LPPQTRRVLDEIKALVKTRCEAEDLEPRTALFSRRELRERLGWGVTQIRAHLERLRDLEYLAARYGRPGSSYQYELLMDPRAETGGNLVGLLDPGKLRVRSEPVGENENPSGGCRGVPRQVQSSAKEGFKENLSACSNRTSGTAETGCRTVAVGE